MTRGNGIWDVDAATPAWLTEPVSRRRILKGGGALAGALLAGGLAACGSGGSAGGGDGRPGSGKTIALSLNGFNTYCQNLAEGVLAGLAGTGYELIGAEAGFDASREVANIKQLVARQPDALIVQAATADGAARASLAAQRAGIPVLCSGWNPVDEDTDAVYYAATRLNSDRAGKLVVDYLAEQGVTSGKVLEITGLDAQPFTVGYKAGLRKAMAAHPGVTVVASQQGLYTADGAIRALKPMLSAHPDAKVVIDHACEMGIAIAGELERQGRGDILHVTSDGNDRLSGWLKKDGGAYLKASRSWSAASEGIACVNILRQKLEHDAAPTDAAVGEEYRVVAETKDPIVAEMAQVIATGKNIDELPPYGRPRYASKIPFGA